MKNQYFLQLSEDFIQWMTRLNYAPQSIKSRKRHLKNFLNWLEENGINQLQEITRKNLEDYNEYLHLRPIVQTTIQGNLGVLKLLNYYLESHGEAPVIKVRLVVQKEIQVERTILNKAEIQQLYESCDNTIMGVRDRVILAVYYGCGVRCTEGINLELGDIDFSDGLLHVRKGKNYKERYIPMSEGVKKSILEWIEHGHPWFCEKNTNILIPNKWGNKSKGKALNKRLQLLCNDAQIDKHITLHCLRHSIATHLLQNGMELESISRFLGHKSLETTTIYTRIVNEIDE